MYKNYLILFTALLTAVSLLAVSNLNQTEFTFQSYKKEYQKTYLREGEEQYRKIIYLKNKAAIGKHNSDTTQTYQQGINQFTDMTLSELSALYADFKIPQMQSPISQQEEAIRLGANVDWVQAGKVSPIIDQGSCGASWAWSAAGAFQSAHMIKGNNILASAQQLLDCTESYGNYGCNGGYMANSFKYMKEKRLHVESDYPYVAKAQKCLSPSGTTWTLSSYKEINTCDNLLNALMNGPVSVAVDLSSSYSYKSGIITNCGKVPSSGSLLVGVADSYWKLKQSFGVKWGENGYFRVARGNTCAICDIASYPII